MLVCWFCVSDVGHYREELILNATLFVVRVWGVQYREELILNIIVFILKVRWRAI